MAESTATTLANSKLALVVAPAGCGKTHLIAEAVGLAKGRQLVLTHTHAGVNAMCRRLEEQGVPTQQYHVCTLDSFALRYAAAYPSVSGWSHQAPADAQWAELRPTALKVLRLRAVEDVLRASYTGVFVDEYQDCSLSQHALVMQLASVLPCRALGDPLQSIFTELNKESALPWGEVTRAFPLLQELNSPHRWAKKNEALGEWLLAIRPALLKGETLDLDGVACLDFVVAEPGIQLGVCKRLLGHDGESVVGLREHRSQCHGLAGKLRNSYSVFEDANGRDLLRAAQTLDGVAGVDCVAAIHKLAKRWLTCLPGPAIKPVLAAVKDGKPIRARRPDLLHLGQALERVRDQGGGGSVAAALDCYAALDGGPTYCSKEIWYGLGAAARHAASMPGMTFRDAAWHERDRHRRMGRRAPRRCLSTPLLVKGLQFDHGIILDTADFCGAEALYVSLTRASRSLTVIGISAKIATTRMAL
jgi:hypothetical protein